MNMHAQQMFSVLSICSYLLVFSFLAHPSTSAPQSFVYAGCSQLKYTPGTPYESNVNSILASLVNLAAFSNYNNFNSSLPGTDVVYGLFQCRGDLSNSDCHDCVTYAVSRIGTLCSGSSGGALQLDGCFVKYDNTSFLGAEDKTVVFKRCGPSIRYDSDVLTQRDALMAYLTGGSQYFRIDGSGKSQSIAQCVQDLSTSECQDCLSEAIGRLKSECQSSTWGDMFLAKCYARFSERGYSSNRDKEDDDDDDMERTLAITIGLIAGVAVIIVFLSFFTRICDTKGGK